MSQQPLDIDLERVKEYLNIDLLCPEVHSDIDLECLKGIRTIGDLRKSLDEIKRVLKDTIHTHAPKYWQNIHSNKVRIGYASDLMENIQSCHCYCWFFRFDCSNERDYLLLHCVFIQSSRGAFLAGICIHNAI
jgi:hypothetical protein